MGQIIWQVTWREACDSSEPPIFTHPIILTYLFGSPGSQSVHSFVSKNKNKKGFKFKESIVLLISHASHFLFVRPLGYLTGVVGMLNDQITATQKYKVRKLHEPQPVSTGLKKIQFISWLLTPMSLCQTQHPLIKTPQMGFDQLCRSDSWIPLQFCHLVPMKKGCHVMIYAFLRAIAIFNILKACL
jgi:hypothetical protein